MYTQSLWGVWVLCVVGWICGPATVVEAEAPVDFRRQLVESVGVAGGSWTTGVVTGSSRGAGFTEGGMRRKSDEFLVTDEPSGFRAVTIEPFVLVTNRGVGWKLVESLLSFLCLIRTVTTSNVCCFSMVSFIGGVFHSLFCGVIPDADFRIVGVEVGFGNQGVLFSEPDWTWGSGGSTGWCNVVLHGRLYRTYVVLVSSFSVERERIGLPSS